MGFERPRTERGVRATMNSPMRTSRLPLVLGLLVASATPLRADPAAATLRVVVVADGEMLGSETRALADLRSKLAKPPSSVVLNNATPTEAAFFAAINTGGSPAIPPEWRPHQAVLVLQVLAPSGVKPKRVSRGLGTVLLFRPPSDRPVYREVIAGEAGTPLTNELLAEWFSRATTLAAKGGK